MWGAERILPSHHSQSLTTVCEIDTLLQTIYLLLSEAARISKMPVQNSNFKNFARPDLATYLLQKIVPATFNSLVCKKGQFTLQQCPRRWFVRNLVITPQKSKLKNHHRNFCLSKQEVFRKLPVQKTGGTGPGQVHAWSVLHHSAWSTFTGLGA